MTQPKTDETQKTSGSRKVLAVFGILFVSIGIFLAAFGLSFKAIMLPKETSQGDMDADIDRLKISITQLEEENKRLKEENEILKNGSSSTSSTTRNSSSSSSSSTTGSSSSNSSSSSSNGSSSQRSSANNN